MSSEDPRDKRIGELEALLAKAMARIAELESMLGINSTNSSKPPSSDPPGIERSWKKPSGRNPGGQPGHAKHERRYLEPNQVVHVRPEKCRCCGKRLHGEDRAPYRHQVIELPVVQSEVTDYLLHTLRCACGVETAAEIPIGVPRRGYGVRLSSAITLLTGGYRLSKRLTQGLLHDLMGVEISLGTVPNLEQEMSAALAAPVEEAAKYVREQPIANLDETGWYQGREKGRAGRAWLWVAVTAFVSVFTIARSRSSEIAKQILGVDFKGILGSDRWSGYNWVEAIRRQLCWAHLIRDFQGMEDRRDAGTQYGTGLLAAAEKMFEWWSQVRDGKLTRQEFQSNMVPVRDEIISLLREAEVCAAAKTAGMAAKILKVKEALFTFVDYEGLEPTNNVAERTVRHGVMYRKLCFGTQGEAGSRYVERILTVVATLRQQRRSVLDFLTEAYSAMLNNSQSPSLLPSSR